jgi:hypothetical protein
VPVARIGHLMALKVLARDDRRRPQDFDDLRALRREAEVVICRKRERRSDGSNRGAITANGVWSKRSTHF